MNAVPEGLPVRLEHVRAAAGRIAGAAVRTPLLRLPLDGEVYAKPENLQRTGSFKFRGAYNRLSLLEGSQRLRGVVADSSGNHAQGIAAAARLLGIPAVIVIPDNAPPIKVERTLGWGAEVVRCGPSSDERLRVARAIEAERGLTYVPPFDDPQIAAGQGTLGLEIAEDLPGVRSVIVCVGGGGLISGVSVAVRSLVPGARIFGVEPELAADAQQSLREGRRVRWPAELTGRTLADGVRTQGLGELNFEIVRALVHEIVTVPEDAIRHATRWFALEAKLAVEPTGALGLAAVLCGSVTPEGPTVVVVSGGNFDPELYASIIAG